MDNEIMVSILCAAYNHENYIADALDGFLQQKTNFRFEILVHDDASTDGTANIIRQYEKRYPNLIKPIYQTENQYSQDHKLVGKIQRARAKGKYIALCEGDDYWIDCNKLQKQYDLLEQYPDCDICATSSYIVNAETKAIVGLHRPSKKNKWFSLEDVIIGGGGFVATNSLLYRASIMKNDYKFFDTLSYDYTLQILGALSGGMLFINDITGCYRSFSKNSWTSRMSKNVEAYEKFKYKVIDMLKVLDEDTDFAYHYSIEMAKNHELYQIQAAYGDYRAMMQNPYYRYQSIKHRIRPFIRRYFRINI